MNQSSQPAPSVRVRVDGTCGTIVLSRPSRRNSLNVEMLGLLQQAFDDLHQQRSVRAVVLTGGGVCFSAGTDLYELPLPATDEAAPTAWFADLSQLGELLVTMLRFPKPIIAAVNGPACGSGLALVAACDLCLAAPTATFVSPDSLRGLSAGPAIPLLAFRLGGSWTSHFLLRNKPIDAAQAQQIGLVHEIVSFDLLWARGRQWADEISAASPIATAMNKRILNETVGEALITQIGVAIAAMAAARTTADAVAGVGAFREKTQPKW